MDNGYRSNSYHSDRRRSGGFSGGGRGPRKSGFTPIPEHACRKTALEKLDIIIPYNMGTKKKKDETSSFQLYLNYAVTNIQEIAGIAPEISAPETIDTEIRKRPDDQVEKLADFFWLFRIDNPGTEFPNFKDLARKLAVKIFELRNFFAHADSKASALICDHETYVFLEGLLFSKAKLEAERPGMRSEKVNKIKLMNDRDPKGAAPRTNYEFTRRGLIFLICLALYKDEAEEFLSSFADFQLPTRMDEERVREELKRKKPTVSAFRAVFTQYSIRRGRDLLKQEDEGFVNFTNLLGYLNKVPAASYDYLALNRENNRLKTLCEASTESEDNKRYKYTLHRRDKDRFVSLAAGCCEDFDLLPSLRFKRLDITPSIGRKRYLFGKAEDNAVRMNRHYTIVNGGIRFEYLPKRHYGKIRINALRSAIGTQEFRKLLFVALFQSTKFNMKAPEEQVDRHISAYFDAYHCLLETLLNAEDTSDISWETEGVMDALVTLSGASPEEIRAEPDRCLERYLPKNLYRFFTGESGIMTRREVRAAIQKKIVTLKTRVVDFQTRLEKLQAWRRNPTDSEGNRLPPPVCGKKDQLSQPPRSCRISEGSYIAWVFRWMNLYLPNDRKFRQLPLGEQHRSGNTDFQYQLVHAAIGKYGLDRKGLEGQIQKIRPELMPAFKRLKAEVDALTNDENRFLRSQYRRDSHGKILRARPSLMFLSWAATNLYFEELERRMEKIEKINDLQTLLKEASRYSIRTGMPLDRKSIIKTILHLDEEEWKRAYDYDIHAPYADRSLPEEEHVVSQVPFPNGFAERILLSETVHRKNEKNTNYTNCLKGGKFDFSKAFSLVIKTNSLCLSDFYDVTPLIAYMKSHKRSEERIDLLATEEIAKWRDDRDNPLPLDFSGAGLNKAIAAIKEAKNQDLLLLALAQKYWDGFNQNNSFSVSKGTFKECTSVSGYFETPLEKELAGGIKIRYFINDLLRPVFTQIVCNGKFLAKCLNKKFPGVKVYSFYDVVTTFREERAKIRQNIKPLLPDLIWFDEVCPIPSEKYGNCSSGQKRDMEYEIYHNHFPSLTREEYEVLAEARNSAMHSRMELIDLDQVQLIIKRLRKF